MTKKKRITQREIGFIQGVAYAAGLMEQVGESGYDIINNSGISQEQLKKYASEFDLEKLIDVFESVYQ